MPLLSPELLDCANAEKHLPGSEYLMSCVASSCVFVAWLPSSSAGPGFQACSGKQLLSLVAKGLSLSLSLLCSCIYVALCIPGESHKLPCLLGLFDGSPRYLPSALSALGWATHDRQPGCDRPIPEARPGCQGPPSSPAGLRLRVRSVPTGAWAAGAEGKGPIFGTCQVSCSCSALMFRLVCPVRT